MNPVAATPPKYCGFELTMEYWPPIISNRLKRQLNMYFGGFRWRKMRRRAAKDNFLAGSELHLTDQRCGKSLPRHLKCFARSIFAFL
jgi:hypothetical protein